MPPARCRSKGSSGRSPTSSAFSIPTSATTSATTSADPDRPRRSPMPSPLVYLRPDVAAEPLVCRWAAYEKMVAPHLLAMVLKSQIDLLTSYVRFPAQHLKARLDPALLGGPWVDYPTDRSQEAEALRQDMIARCAPQLELAAGIKALDELLRREAVGGSLGPLYARVPDAPRGFVMHV